MPENVIDPATGKPVDPNAAPPGTPADPAPGSPQYVTIPADEWNILKSRLDSLDTGGGYQGHQPPPTPSGPSVADQVKAIDTDIATLDSKIKDAEENSRPIGALMNQRSDLAFRRQRLQIQAEDIDPIRTVGFGVMDSLSQTVTEGQMPHLKHDFIKRSYDSVMKTMAPEHRMNPEVRRMAYQKAVGENVDKLTKLASEEAIRQHNEAHPAPPTGTPPPRFVDSKGGKLPKPEEIFDKEGMAALRHTANGDPDTFYRKLGYASYADWWEKTGREYYGEGGNE